MNRSDARGRQIPCKGWIGEFKLLWRASYEPVLKICPDGRKDGVRYFETEQAAELEAWRVKNEIEQPVMLRAGDRIGAAKSAAEQLFRRNA